MKLLINQQLGEICKLVNTGQISDSFVKHFAQNHNTQRTKINKNQTRVKERKTKFTIGEARSKVKVVILWQGNEIYYNKSFRKLSCSLCTKEKISILKYARDNPNLIINTNSEFYGACRHKSKFHRYAATPHPSTDDEQ